MKNDFTRLYFCVLVSAAIVASAPFAAAQVVRGTPTPTPTPGSVSPAPSATPQTGGPVTRATPTPAPAPGPDAQRVWNNTGTNFNTNASWVGNGPAPTTGDVAAFNAAAVTQPQLNSNTSISGLYFTGTGTSGYNLTNLSGQTLTLTATGTTIGAETGDSTAVAIGAENTSGTNTINVPIILGAAAAATQTIIQASGGTLVINGVISEANAGIKLTLSGAGTVTFAGANTYTGTTTISGGTLQLGNGGTTGSLSTTSAIVDNANLTINRSNAVAQGTDFSAAAITGSGSFTQAGAGTTTLSALNTFSGGTNINGGTLALQFPSGNNKNNVLPSGTLVTFGGGALTVTGGNKANSQTLGNLTFSSGANAITLTGPTSPDTLTVTTAGNNTWTRSVGSTLNITLNAQTVFTSSPTVANSIVVGSGGTAFATVAGANWATVSGGNIAALGTYQTGTTPSGWATTDNVSLTGNPSANVGNQSINSLRLAGTSTVTIGGGNTLTLSSGGLLATGTQANMITGGTLTGASGKDLVVHQYSSGNLTINSVIANNTSATGLTKSGTGTLILTGNNTYTGTTFINAGTLTVDNNNSTTTGKLGGTSAITINSGGTLLFAQSSGGSANIDRINDSATVTLNGGTFNTGGLSEHGASNNTAGIGALTLQSNSIIDMGSGTSILAFADSHLSSWSGTLKIYNWSGTPNTGGGTDQLYFGSTSGGLTSTQLGEIQFFSDAGITQYGGATAILSDGEVVPIPEPSTWIGGILALGAISYTHRRRLRGLLRRTSDW